MSVSGHKFPDLVKARHILLPRNCVFSFGLEEEMGCEGRFSLVSDPEAEELKLCDSF